MRLKREGGDLRYRNKLNVNGNNNIFLKVASINVVGG